MTRAGDSRLQPAWFEGEQKIFESSRDAPLTTGDRQLLTRYSRAMQFLDLLSLAIGLLVAFYWGRVIKLVRKTRKETGHSAHFFPPELVGRLLRIIWYPTVAAWIIVPLALPFWRDPPEFFRRLYQIPILQALALAGAIVVLILTMICWRKMGRDWRMGIDPNEKNNLIVTGPFARVRHPIYALQQLFAILSAIVVPAPIMIMIALLEVLLLSFEAIREERHLVKVHGELYRNYMRQTGRFIPSLKSAA